MPKHPALPPSPPPPAPPPSPNLTAVVYDRGQVDHRQRPVSTHRPQPPFPSGTFEQRQDPNPRPPKSKSGPRPNLLNHARNTRVAQRGPVLAQPTQAAQSPSGSTNTGARPGSGGARTDTNDRTAAGGRVNRLRRVAGFERLRH